MHWYKLHCGIPFFCCVCLCMFRYAYIRKGVNVVYIISSTWHSKKIRIAVHCYANVWLIPRAWHRWRKRSVRHMYLSYKSSIVTLNTIKHLTTNIFFFKEHIITLCIPGYKATRNMVSLRFIKCTRYVYLSTKKCDL